jgi:hypothetical protein
MIIEPQNLTPAARAALVAADWRPGSSLPNSATLRVAAELATYGLIGIEATLTKDGAIVRARIIDGLLEAMES